MSITNKKLTDFLLLILFCKQNVNKWKIVRYLAKKSVYIGERAFLCIFCKYMLTCCKQNKKCERFREKNLVYRWREILTSNRIFIIIKIGVCQNAYIQSEQIVLSQIQQFLRIDSAYHGESVRYIEKSKWLLNLRRYNMKFKFSTTSWVRRELW